jgi:hypothetical protein
VVIVLPQWTHNVIATIKQSSCNGLSDGASSTEQKESHGLSGKWREPLFAINPTA